MPVGRLPVTPGHEVTPTDQHQPVQVVQHPRAPVPDVWVAARLRPAVRPGVGPAVRPARGGKEDGETTGCLDHVEV